mgnify:CR=1 FL=1
MFDLSRITETLGNLLGNAPLADAFQSSDLMGVLANSGIDLASLQGLDPQQVVELLASHGIDISQYAPDQLQGLLDQLGSGQDVIRSASELLGRFTRS